jgi:type VI secretion system protein ImpH
VKQDMRGLPRRRVALSEETLERLQSRPWDYGFIPLMRRIGADPAIDPIGTARRPYAEPFRLGQKPSLAFAPSEIASAELSARGLRVRLFGLGMLGPNGPLPVHVTEIAREREESRGDNALVDFLDVFHHRYLTLLYRAWACAQSAAGLDRSELGNDRFSFYVGCLTGQDSLRLGERELPAHARLAASPHLVREARDPDSLGMTISQYFGVPVSIEEYTFHWISLAAPDRTHLARSGAASTMGEGAILGEQVPDCQYRFRIVVGPVGIDEYLRFTPQGADLPRVVDWVRCFVDREFDWELELRIHAESVPPACVGGPQRLGWSGWLGKVRHGQPVTGMRFDPEAYVQDAGTADDNLGFDWKMHR